MKNKKQTSIWVYTLSVLSAGSLVILALLFWNITIEKKGTLEAARIQATTAYEKDIIYRRWNAWHGGVYAPETKETTPNSYLNILDRDIQTPGGAKLTKINPAYMTRQIHEISEKTNGVKGHITSLNPIRPENAPDDWEKKALKTFEKGKKEESSVEVIDDVTYLRFMRPLITEKKCLNCHAIQGYKQGDIRGGISVSIPLSPLKKVEQTHIQILSITYGLLWLVGTIGVLIGMFILNRQIHNQVKVDKMQGVLEMAGAICHELNQPLMSISGFSQLLSDELSDDNIQKKNLAEIQNQVDRLGRITKRLITITIYKPKKYFKGNIIDIEASSYDR